MSWTTRGVKPSQKAIDPSFGANALSVTEGTACVEAKRAASGDQGPANPTAPVARPHHDAGDLERPFVRTAKARDVP